MTEWGKDLAENWIFASKSAEWGKDLAEMVEWGKDFDQKAGGAKMAESLKIKIIDIPTLAFWNSDWEIRIEK